MTTDTKIAKGLGLLNDAKFGYDYEFHIAGDEETRCYSSETFDTLEEVETNRRQIVMAFKNAMCDGVVVEVGDGVLVCGNKVTDVIVRPVKPLDKTEEEKQKEIRNTSEDALLRSEGLIPDSFLRNQRKPY